MIYLYLFGTCFHFIYVFMIIGNITVIKDAAAASLYGSRAANGVILITTKKVQRDVLRLH